MEGPSQATYQADADRAAVRALYRILLGRLPESDAVVATHEGRPLAPFISFILQSPEFRQLAERLAQGEALPHLRALSAVDLREAAAWLSSGDETLPDEPDWWSMIGIVLRRAPRSAVAEYGPLSDYVERRIRAASALPPALARLATFDPSWYRRASRRADAAIRDGTADDEISYFLATGRGRAEQLLPYFSEGLGELYDRLPSDATVSEVVCATVRAAQQGITGHWLFSEAYYLEAEQTGDQPSQSDDMDDAAASFVRFIERQGRDDVRPHPLFCPSSYARLNDLTGEDATFDHYVRAGMFDGLQTTTLFEPSFYANLDPQVRIAVLKGDVRNELHHFLAVGIFKDSRFSPYFDVDFYLAAYPDVRAEIAAGLVPSATWHFIHRGLAQGRSPSHAFSVDYYRTRYPHVDAEITELGIGSALEHYLLVGRQRGYLGDVPLVERMASLDEGKIIFQRRALRSLDRRLRRPSAFPVLKDAPIRLSVIVPVCGQAHHTARLLDCAQFAAGHLLAIAGIGAELIIVDNGSRDETSELLAATAGIVTVHFQDAIGYPRAIAAGVEASRGDLVLVANNDVEFDPDTFEHFVRLLDGDPTIGVLGGLVVLPNERLQDAGCFVDREGFTVGVGRHEDPWSAFVRGVNEVDYCAGCFFGFRRADYDDVGGIDERFSPGYYEEVDFAFRVRRQLGKKAVIASDIQVVHLEHGSFGGGRTPVAAEPVIRRNRSAFLAKHAPALADMPAHKTLLHDNAARPNAIARPRALVIVSRLPATDGGWLASLLEGLSEADVPFEILALDAHADGDSFADRRVNIIRGWLPGRNPIDIVRRSAARFSHIVATDRNILRRFDLVLAEAGIASEVTLIACCDGLPVLDEIGEAERLGGPMRDEDRLALVRDAISTRSDVALWLAATEVVREQLERAGVRRAVTIDRDDRERRIHVVLIGCGDRDSDAADALAWARHSVCPAVPDARRLDVSDILGADAVDGEALSVGLSSLRDASGEELVVAVIVPRLEDSGEVRGAFASGLPVLMAAHHRRMLEDEIGVTARRLAVVDDASSAMSYGTWFARLLSDSTLVEVIVTAQQEWLAGDGTRPDPVDVPRVAALR